MHERRKSDSPVVPASPPNNAEQSAAEAVEERGLPKGNATSATRPGQSRYERAKRAGSRAPSRSKGQAGAVHRALAPRRCRSPQGGLLGVEPEGRDGGGRRDMGGLRAGSRSEPSRSPRSGPQGRIPGEAGSESVHTEARRAVAAARDQRA